MNDDSEEVCGDVAVDLEGHEDKEVRDSSIGYWPPDIDDIVERDREEAPTGEESHIDKDATASINFPS